VTLSLGERRSVFFPHELQNLADYHLHRAPHRIPAAIDLTKSPQAAPLSKSGKGAAHVPDME
jgi:hypothetical protein